MNSLQSPRYRASARRPSRIVSVFRETQEPPFSTGLSDFSFRYLAGVEGQFNYRTGRTESPSCQAGTRLVMYKGPRDL